MVLIVYQRGESAGFGSVVFSVENVTASPRPSPRNPSVSPRPEYRQTDYGAETYSRRSSVEYRSWGNTEKIIYGSRWWYVIGVLSVTISYITNSYCWAAQDFWFKDAISYHIKYIFLGSPGSQIFKDTISYHRIFALSIFFAIGDLVNKWCVHEASVQYIRVSLKSEHVKVVLSIGDRNWIFMIDSGLKGFCRKRCQNWKRSMCR